MKRIIALLAALCLCFCAAAPLMPPGSAADTPMVILHRGNTARAPENTVAAILTAQEAGYPCCEIDIRRTADGYWVVIHDTNISRMTDGSGRVRSMTLAEISQARINEGEGLDRFPDEHIPELNEMLDACLQYHVRPVIEIKKGHNEEDMISLARLIGLRADRGNFIFFSADNDLTAALKYYLPDICAFYSKKTVNDSVIEYCVQNRFDGIFCSAARSSKETVDAVHAAGMQCGFGLVDREDVAAFCVESGVDYFVTHCISPDFVFLTPKTTLRVFLRIGSVYRNLLTSFKGYFG